MIWAEFPEVRRELERVQEVILEEVSRPGGRLAEGLRELATRDAKLLRPAFTILSARIQTGGAAAEDRIIRIAAAIELLHMASLIHDDIVDEANSRRGGPALHVQYGSRTAVLMGDYLFSRCFALVADHAEPENAALLSAAVGHIISSEIAESDGGYDTQWSVRRYMHRIVGKTAVLFSLAFHLGASEASENVEHDERVVEILRRIGYNIGVGFQIIDDVLDLFGNARRTGKPTATDIRAGVMTLPVILAVNSTQRARLIRVLERIGSAGTYRPKILRFRRERAIDRVRAEVVDAGGRAGAEAAAEHYTRRAEREINRLPDGPDRATLRVVTERLLKRAS
jgi:heptaprenyl diphosphate synthase